MHSNKRVCLLFLRLLLMLLLDDPAVVIITYIGRSDQDQVTIGSAFRWMRRCLVLLWWFENIDKCRDNKNGTASSLIVCCFLLSYINRRSVVGVVGAVNSVFTINRSVPN